VSETRRVLMACTNDWESPFQVGSHHLARGLVRAGYDVAFISDPISPLHLCRGWTTDLGRRHRLYRQGGQRDLNGRLWAYVPGAALTPHNQPILRTGFVQRSWHRWTWPSVAGLARSRGFGTVDLLYIDSIAQAFWLDAIEHRRSVYRVADYNPHFEKYTPAARAAEEAIARRVDLVVYPSQPLRSYVEALGPRRSALLANGVDYAHFAKPAPQCPAEYTGVRGPIAVYVGVIPEWFHFAWLLHAAERLPEMAFVLIGPDRLARHHLGELPNVHLLGVRPYASVPALLQFADVGLMPFDVARNPAGVEVLQPQKLFAYFASGLPVVSADWKNLRDLGCPAHRCATADEFVSALRQAVAAPGDAEAYRRYAAQFDWGRQVERLLQELDTIPPRQCAA
jgi:glycosyltransferase involved in cell wall biosynthesis